MSSSQHSSPNPFLKLALDLGPLILFFLIYRYAGIMAATTGFMIITAASLGISWWIERRLHPMPLVTAVVVLVFGGLTLWYDNETFIKLKPTLIYSIFAVLLLGGLAFKRPLLQPLMGNLWRLDSSGWKKLTFRFGIFFLLMAVANEIVWRHFSTNDWVTWKTFGIFPMTLVFGFLQAPLIRRHSLPDEESSG